MRHGASAPDLARRFQVFDVAVRVFVVAGAALLIVGVVPAVSGATNNITVRDEAELTRTEQALIATCMRTRGFSYWPMMRQQVPPAVQFPFVITSLSWAKAHGFGSNPTYASLAATNRNVAYFEHLSHGEQARYILFLNGSVVANPDVEVALPTGGVLGHSTAGCTAQAEGRLYGNYMAWFRADSVYTDLPNLVTTGVLSTSSYQESVVRWSACMRTAGYRYRTPRDAMMHFLQAPVAQSGLARSTAVMEVRCATQVGLIATVAEAVRIEQAVTFHHFQNITRVVARAQASALVRAPKILESLKRSALKTAKR